MWGQIIGGIADAGGKQFETALNLHQNAWLNLMNAARGGGPIAPMDHSGIAGTGWGRDMAQALSQSDAARAQAAQAQANRAMALDRLAADIPQGQTGAYTGVAGTRPDAARKSASMSALMKLAFGGGEDSVRDAALAKLGINVTQDSGQVDPAIRAAALKKIAQELGIDPASLQSAGTNAPANGFVEGYEYTN